MISLDPTIRDTCSTSTNAESVRSIWKYMLQKVTIQGGPFAGFDKSDQLEELVDTAVRLFPTGIPDRSKKWTLPHGVLVTEYAPFLKKVFLRTVPTPISEFRG